MTASSPSCSSVESASAGFSFQTAVKCGTRCSCGKMSSAAVAVLALLFSTAAYTKAQIPTAPTPGLVARSPAPLAQTPSVATNSPPSMSPAASAPGNGLGGSLRGTDTFCCQQLSAIQFSTNLPVLIANTGGVPVSNNSGEAAICTCGVEAKGNKGGDYNGTVKFETRGGTDTQVYNQIFQYEVKLPVADCFMGMPKSKDWIIYGQENDTFGLHQWLGYNLSRATGEYAARTAYLELFIVDDDTALAYPKHYHGLYLAIEAVKRGKDRVHVDAAKKNTATALTGGYIMEFSHSSASNPGQNPKNRPTVNGTQSGKQWLVKYPKDASAAQITNLQGYLNNFESALYGPTFTDPITGWRQFANESTFVDWFLATELVKNGKHSYHSSAYMHKEEANKTFEMGPSWNQVEGFGQCCGYPFTGYQDNGVSGPGRSGGSAISPNGWIFDICVQPERCASEASYDAGDGIAVWFVRLWQDQGWVTSTAQRYQHLRAGPWASAQYAAYLAELQQQLQAAGLRTLQKWSSLLYQPQYYPTMGDQYNETFSTLSNWTLTRLAWMDGALQQAAASTAQAQAPFAVSYPPVAALASVNTAG